MENIFEGVKFGDKFLTKSGRVALYIGKDRYSHNTLIVDDASWSFYAYLDDGTFAFDGEVLASEKKHPLDLVSRLSENIDLKDNTQLMDIIDKAVQIGFDLCYNRFKEK